MDGVGREVLQGWGKQKDIILQKMVVVHSKTGVVKTEF